MLVLKNVLKPRLKPSSSGGGRVPTRQVPYRQNRVFIQVIILTNLIKISPYFIFQFC